MSEALVQWSMAFLSFKSQFGSYEEEIKKLAREVQKEASLASKQAQRIEIEFQTRERAEQSNFRRTVANFGDSFNRNKERDFTQRLEIERRRLEREKLEILDSLSTYDYQSAFRRLRRECVPGTSQWICETSEFHEWMSRSSQRLWLTGKCKYTLAEALKRQLIRKP